MCVYKNTLHRLCELGDAESQVSKDPGSLLFDALSRSCSALCSMGRQAEKVELPLAMAGAVEADASPPLPGRISFTREFLNVALEGQPVTALRLQVIRDSLCTGLKEMLEKAKGLTMANAATCWKSGLPEDASLKDVVAVAREKFGSLDGAGLRCCRDELVKAMGWVVDI